MAVGTDKGLVVPVLRDADQLSLAEIEKGIAALGKKARDGHLAIEDMSGGTFTITNGGIYGSLMSTPILNMPQAAILGMHNIVQRPIAVDGKVEIRPMMYLAVSYDHRIVDGKEAVTFLVALKNAIEDPTRPSECATAKLFMHGGSQAVRLPKAFRFEGREVSVRRDGDAVILEPVPAARAPTVGELERFFAEVDALRGDLEIVEPPRDSSPWRAPPTL